MGRVDWPLWAGMLLGAFVGSVVVLYAAAQSLGLVLWVPPGFFNNRPGHWVIDRVGLVLWGIVGLIVGAFLGALAVTLLRIASRRAGG